MCDADINRRAFTAASIAAGAMMTAATVAHAQAAGVTETNIEIKTPDGMTDAALYTPPGKGPFPGALIFTDIFGLRPAFRAMGQRLAASGYVVLVPNPFYRTKKGLLVEGPFDFSKDFAKLQPHTAAIKPDGTTKDLTAWVAYIDGLPQVSKKAKLGVTGYCMGGPRVVEASAIRADRIGGAMSNHGGGVVSDAPTSPHLMAPKIKAKTFFAIAQNDAMRQPDQADKLKAAYAAAGNPCGAEVYKADHGWCVSDGAAYNKGEAERAWTQMLATFKDGGVA
jgi:carboxymethylenebutenolidase